MEKLICITAICPLRRHPNYASEIVSQLLFGETALLLEKDKDFFKVRCEYDNYEGWCMANQVDTLGVEKTKLKGYVTNHNYRAFLNGNTIYLPVGCPVIADIESKNYKLTFPQQNYHLLQKFAAGTDEVINFTKLFENVPYLWGGRSSYGIDCSGFTQQVYKLMGITLLRDAYQQALEGAVVPDLKDSKCGDLAFFTNRGNKITHVGILLNPSTIIHAAGYVHIDKMDENGIVHSITGQGTHDLECIKRFF